MGAQRSFASLAWSAKGKVTRRERFLAEMDAVIPCRRLLGLIDIGADTRGLVHTVRATAAAVADITQLPELLHGAEREVFGDQAYWKEDDRKFLQAWGMRYRVNRRPTSQRPLSERWRMINRARSRTRARGEHAFRVVKHLWGFAKVRYRGLAKNLARARRP